MRSHPENQITPAIPRPSRRRFLRQLAIGTAAATILPRAFGALPKAMCDYELRTPP